MSDQEENIKKFQIKRLIQSLRGYRGDGTSVISLYIPPNSQLSDTMTLLTAEYGKAVNIKSRVNKLSVRSAITMAQNQLKHFINKCPATGLCIFVGDVSTSDSKSKKIALSHIPYRALNTSKYICGNKFWVEPLENLLEANDRYGFIIMDGKGTLFGSLRGSVRETISKMSVNLPQKHGRGGQSAPRFGRIRMGARNQYMKDVAENATRIFIGDDHKANVKGIVLAGSADFKNDLNQSAVFDPRLQEIVVSIVDVAYGGEMGFSQAIEQSAESLAGVRLVHEKQVLKGFFEAIAKDTGDYSYGVQETMMAFHEGAIKELIIWEGLPHLAVQVKDEDEELGYKYIYLTPEQHEQASYMFNSKTGQPYEEIDNVMLVDKLLEDIEQMNPGNKPFIEFVSDSSAEGTQFVGFGGLGGFLHFNRNHLGLDFNDDDDSEFDDDEDDWI
eukprot:TRINITY_DN2979_c1_g2_i1.p1 TRINITY_DN2979_c1_g2~~TRINITY_DN2979_c1_g2_i1.p1  ORF type:complete len:443 (+),score=138.96 TRINITY_DN2979_c1_g2_i1:814-2142(+)